MEVGMAREGYWNNEKFTEFVSVLALEYKRRGYKGIILVMDSSSYHKKAQEKKVGEALGIQIMWFYLPKNSPWPVESEWSLFRKFEGI